MIINGKQKTLIVVGVLVFILAGLFPPWLYTLHVNNIDREKPAGYAPIFDPPYPENDDIRYGVELDVSRLTVQWVVILTATGLCVFLTTSRK
ncbi:MAG: hypothetical protein GY785_03275 [Gammaproteobacteria bacterium]|nr:hypothetical protein [Gammaproteobacteria bacterium]